MIFAALEPNAAALAALALSLVSLLVMLAFAVLVGSLFFPWMRAFLGGAPVRITQLIGMRLRGVPVRMIVDASVALVQRGHAHELRTCTLVESAYLAQRGLIQSAGQLADIVERQHIQAAN